MLGVVLGFSGRIGRLRYLLLSIGLAFATVAALIAIVFPAVSHAGPSGLDGLKTRAVLIPLAAVIPAFLWFSFALQAKRIRDIGWPPGLVLPAWLAVDVFDQVLVQSGAVQAVHGQQSTLFGLLLNLAGCGVLLFWPGTERGSGAPHAPRRAGTGPEPRPSPAPVTAASVGCQNTPAGFGRRGTR